MCEPIVNLAAPSPGDLEEVGSLAIARRSIPPWPLFGGGEELFEVVARSHGEDHRRAVAGLRQSDPAGTANEFHTAISARIIAIASGEPRARPFARRRRPRAPKRGGDDASPSEKAAPERQ